MKAKSAPKKRHPLSIAELTAAWKTKSPILPTHIEMMSIQTKIYIKGMSSYTGEGNAPYQVAEIVLQGTPGPGCTLRTASLIFFPEGRLLGKPTFNPVLRSTTIFYPMEDFLAVKAVLESSENVECFFAEQPRFELVHGWILATR